MLRTALNSLNKRVVPLNIDFLINKNIIYSRNNSTVCWKCGDANNIGNIFCKSCSAIQKPNDTKNFFRVFDFPVEYNVDNKVLTKKYRNLQSQLHPDKFSSKSNEEKDISQEFSSLLNKAYSTLSTPLNRALHILLLNGYVIDETDKIEDSAFLLEMMGLNEEIDDAEDEKMLRLLLDKNICTINNIVDKISICFEHSDFKKAKENVMKMKYYNSINKRINGIMREKGIVD